MRIGAIAVALLLVGCRSLLGFEEPSPSPSDLAGPHVAFSFPESGADELTGALAVEVVLSEPLEDVVVATFGIVSGGSATTNADFMLAETEIVFEPRQTRASIFIEIASDPDDGEPAESFQIALSSAVGANIDPARTIHRITIADHILPRIAFATASSSSDENVPSLLVLSLTAPAEPGSSIVIGVAGGPMNPASTADSRSPRAR